MIDQPEPEFTNEQIEEELRDNPAEQARWQSITTQTLSRRAHTYALRVYPHPSAEQVQLMEFELKMFESFFRGEYLYNRFHSQMWADKMVDEHIAVPSRLPPLQTDLVLAEAMAILADAIH